MYLPTRSGFPDRFLQRFLSRLSTGTPISASRCRRGPDFAANQRDGPGRNHQPLLHADAQTAPAWSPIGCRPGPNHAGNVLPGRGKPCRSSRHGWIIGGEPRNCSIKSFDWLVRHYATVIDRRSQIRDAPELDSRSGQIPSRALRIPGPSPRPLVSRRGPGFRRAPRTDQRGLRLLVFESRQARGQASGVAHRPQGSGRLRRTLARIRGRCWIDALGQARSTRRGPTPARSPPRSLDAVRRRHAWSVEPGWWGERRGFFGSGNGLCEYCSRR